MNEQLHFQASVRSFFKDVLDEHSFVEEGNSDTSWYIRFNNTKCVLQFIYDFGYVVCDCSDALVWAEYKNRVVNGAPVFAPAYSVWSIWKQLYRNDEANYDYDLYGELDVQLLFIKRVLTEKLLHVMKGDFSWASGLGTARRKIMEPSRATVYTPTREQLISQWWEERRLLYNKGLILSGVIAFVLYGFAGSILIRDFELSLFSLFFQGMGYILMMVVANLFYFLGAFIDRHHASGNDELYRMRLFKLGCWFSFSLPFIIPLFVIARYWGQAGSD